jgi:hypothetical protein
VDVVGGELEVPLEFAGIGVDGDEGVRGIYLDTL